MTDAGRYEVELKFPLAAERDAVVARLQGLGARLVATIEQSDRYFNHPQRDFAQSDEAFRIRSVGTQNFVTYKGPKIDTRTKTRPEIELPLGDGEALAEQFAQMLTKLSFRPVATVRKQRACWELVRGDWHFEVAIDDVEEVGDVSRNRTGQRRRRPAARSASRAGSRRRIGAPRDRAAFVFAAAVERSSELTGRSQIAVQSRSQTLRLTAQGRSPSGGAVRRMLGRKSLAAGPTHSRRR